MLVYSCQPIEASVANDCIGAIKLWRSAPEAFHAGHYKDLTETGNRARKVSGTQGSVYAFISTIRVQYHEWNVKRKQKKYTMTEF